MVLYILGNDVVGRNLLGVIGNDVFLGKVREED